MGWILKFVVDCELEEFKKYYKRNGFAGNKALENLDSNTRVAFTSHKTLMLSILNGS